MRALELDASGWRTVLEAYDAILSELQAPEWHGRNLNALAESIGYGGINEVEPPFVLRFVGTGRAPPEVAAFLRDARAAVEEALADFNSRGGEQRQAFWVLADDLS